MMQNLCEDVTNQIEEEESTTEERLPSVTPRRHVWPYTERQEALASSYFGGLPNEILVRLFCYLPVYDLISVGLVCRTFKMVADLEEVWKHRRRSKFHRVYCQTFEHSFAHCFRFLRHILALVNEKDNIRI